MTALLNTLSVLITVVPILLAVAFMTLIERKVLRSDAAPSRAQHRGSLRYRAAVR